VTMRSTDYALLSQATYKDPVVESRGPHGVTYKDIVLDGVSYRPLDHFDDPKTGFQATAYQNKVTNEVIIAYRGTEFDREAKQDGLADAAMTFKGTNVQAAESTAFTQRVIDAAKANAELTKQPVNVTVTGHSLGGTLAEINAYKFGLHGETFNAFGAAGLAMGIPAGGNQVIDNVRATDVVSAASPHFGQVRVFAVAQDTQALSQAGYTDSRVANALLPHSPILGTIQKDAHAIDNFVPGSKLLGSSIMSPANEKYAETHHVMIQPYRNSIEWVRTAAFAEYKADEPLINATGAVVHQAVRTGQEAVHLGEAFRNKAVEDYHGVVNAASRGIERTVVETKRAELAAEQGAERVGHAVVRGYDAARDGASRGIEGAINAGSRAVDGTVHAAKAEARQRMDHPAHPDYKLFQQSLGAVHRLDAQHGRTPDQHSTNLAGGVTVAAATHGLRKVDHVVLSDDGSHAFAVQGDLRSSHKQVARGIDTGQAVNTPIEHHTQALQQVHQAQAQQQVQQQVQQQAPQMQQPVQTPGMSR
jgi:hypothetical protein